MDKDYLCEFTIKQLNKKPLTTDREIDGKKVQVTETVACLIDKKFALLRPLRRLTRGAEIFYAKTVNEMMSKGLMSVHMVSKRYDNDGGPYNELETKRIEQIQLRKLEVSAIYFDHKLKHQLGDESKEDFEAIERTIFKEVKDLQEELNEIQKPYLSIFNQTAEFKARSQTITWWFFALLMEFDETTNAYVPFFKDKDFEKNMDTLEAMEQSRDAYKAAIIEKALFYISYWVGGGSLDKSELDSLENEFKSFTTYAPEVEQAVINAVPAVPTQPAESINENPPRA